MNNQSQQQQKNYWINTFDSISGELLWQRPVPDSILDKFHLDKFDTGNQNTKYWYSPDYINRKQKLLDSFINGDEFAGEILDGLGKWELTGELLMEQIELQETNIYEKHD